MTVAPSQIIVIFTYTDSALRSQYITRIIDIINIYYDILYKNECTTD